MENTENCITPDDRFFDAIFYFYPEKNVIHPNSEFLSLVGFKKDRNEFSLDEFAKFVFPEDSDLFRNSLESDSPQVRLDLRLVGSEGQWIWLRFRKVKDGRRWIFVGVNLTKEKEKEQILLSSEAMQNIGGWLLDLSTEKLHWTPSTFFLHDLNPEVDEIDLEKAISFYKEGENRNKLLEMIDSAISDGRSFEGEFKIVTAKGEEKWVCAKGRPAQVEESILQLYGTIRDITQEKSNELALIRAKELFQSTFDHAGIGMALVSPTGNVIAINRKLSDTFGYSNRDIRGRHFTEFTYPDDLDIGKKQKEKLDRGLIDYYTVFKRYTHKSGRIIYAKLITTLIRDDSGAPLHYISQVEDLSELQRAKSDLKRSETKFREIFNATFQLCAVLEIDGTLIEANQTALDFAGLQLEEVKGKKFWKTGWWKNSDDGEEYLEKSIAAAANGNIKRYQSKILDHRGKENLIDFTLKPLSDEYGKVKAIIAEGRIIQDLFEAKQDLETMIQKLTVQNEKLRNFTQIVSHNLRSHASNIHALTTLLTEDYENMELHDNLNKASGNLLETIDHLNSIVKIREKADNEKTNIEVRTVVNKTIENLRSLIKQKKASVYNAVPDNLKFKSIPAYIDSILLNLISNALKYSRDEQSAQILISAARTNNSIRISVTDNGLGLDLDKYGDKLFGMYKTFHANKDAKGIGLFITKNQVEALGGHIEVESEVNYGSKFIIQFPDYEQEVIPGG